MWTQSLFSHLKYLYLYLLAWVFRKLLNLIRRKKIEDEEKKMAPLLALVIFHVANDF